MPYLQNQNLEHRIVITEVEKDMVRFMDVQMEKWTQLKKYIKSSMKFYCPNKKDNFENVRVRMKVEKISYK